MRCQNCNQEAAVHLTEAVGDGFRELHYCRDCARANGVTVPSEPPPLPLDDVLHKFVVAHLGELVGDLARRRCPCCRILFMEFRGAGRLGCPHDYDAFREGLLPILSKTHGATRHVGKHPARGHSQSHALIQLRVELQAAINHQNYERAAQVRDAIRDALKESH